MQAQRTHWLPHGWSDQDWKEIIKLTRGVRLFSVDLDNDIRIGGAGVDQKCIAIFSSHLRYVADRLDQMTGESV